MSITAINFLPGHADALEKRGFLEAGENPVEIEALVKRTSDDVGKVEAVLDVLVNELINQNSVLVQSIEKFEELEAHIKPIRNSEGLLKARQKLLDLAKISGISRNRVFEVQTCLEAYEQHGDQWLANLTPNGLAIFDQLDVNLTKGVELIDKIEPLIQSISEMIERKTRVNK